MTVTVTVTVTVPDVPMGLTPGEKFGPTRVDVRYLP